MFCHSQPMNKLQYSFVHLWSPIVSDASLRLMHMLSYRCMLHISQCWISMTVVKYWWYCFISYQCSYAYTNSWLVPALVVCDINSWMILHADIHLQGQLCHNNVCLSSVFVSEDGSWKIGGIEFACPFDQASINYLQKCQPLRNQAAIAPEEKV